ncbi:nucleoporin NUP42-like [Planococcus citri]|uniref:nucleoporin NUP42-like n=1 Tax=Planococcus citri TaxID=170843 RepID=UPI0031F7EEB5
MSQICRYYLKGACRYGNSCHFIHENNHYSKNNRDYSEHSYGYNRNNYNESYFSYGNRDSHSSYEPARNYNKNYNRYHVDHRQQSQPTEIKPEDITPSQFVDLIKTEVKQFEDRHVWKLSVISPLKYFGNIPGFQDYSPEEIRYQFYMASSNNTLHEFKRTMDELRDNLILSCQRVNNSASAHNIAKQMMSGNSTEETVNSFPTSSASSSTFKFDINQLPKQSAEFAPQQSVPQSTALSSFSFANPPSFNTANNAQFNSINPQSFPTEPSQANAQMNAFSFNSQFVSTAPAAASFPGTSQQSQPPVNENNPCYSRIEELSSEKLQAFRDPTFKYGYIPLQPPPKELCNRSSY